MSKKTRLKRMRLKRIRLKRIRLKKMHLKQKRLKQKEDLKRIHLEHAPYYTYFNNDTYFCIDRFSHFRVYPCIRINLDFSHYRLNTFIKMWKNRKIII